MAKEDDSNPTGENEDETGTENENEDEDSEDEDSEDDGDDSEKEEDKPNPELAKAIARRDRAISEARRLRKELDEKNKKDEEKDPVAEANGRLVRTAAHGVLRGLGVESKEDRIEILDMLNLSDIDVDEDGADEDAIEEKIDLLRRAFGAKSGAPGRTRPNSVKSKRETKETNSDPDAARYARIIGRR